MQERIREGFECQPLMATLGAQLVSVEVGEVNHDLPFRENLT